MPSRLPLNHERDVIADLALDHFIESSDFNGLGMHILARVGQFSGDRLKLLTRELIELDMLTLRHDGNPFIKAFRDPPKEFQIQSLESAEIEDVVIYPSNSLLANYVDRSKWQDRPYSLMLALGEGQLEHFSFDLSILEIYRNDPRYRFRVDDTNGTIYLHDEHSSTVENPDRDDIHLETFGFSYDEEMRRSVATFVYYLHTLSPQHQQMWKAKQLTSRGKIHPDYFRSSILGQFPETIPVLTAFTIEIRHINELSKLMGRPPLFKSSFEDNARPPNLGFLIRPTTKEFNDFVLTLDQTMSDNINRDFFQNEVPYDEEIVRKDGRIEVRQKGTIAILADWLRTKVSFTKGCPEEIIEIFRNVRKLRQTPAHSIKENQFDPEIFRKQRELIIDAYKAMSSLRAILKNHPNCQKYEIEDSLKAGAIRTW